MNDKENRKILAANILRYMDEKGVTRQQVCDDLGFRYSTFRDWVKGITYPRIGRVEAMASYFGCEKSDLIEDKEKKPAENGRLTEKQKMLMDIVQSLPPEKEDLILRTLQAILADDL